MSTISPPLPQSNSSARTLNAPTFENAQEWHHALGDVPLERIVFNPLPGTATEIDCIQMVEHHRLVELLDGTLVEKGMGNYESLIASIIIHALIDFVIPRKLGTVGGEASMVRTMSRRVRLPDVGFTSYDRLPDHKASRDAIVSVTPDLLVEVLSKNNTALEIKQKLTECFESGTRLAWVVDPKSETVDVYLEADHMERTLHIGESLDGGEVLLGFILSLETIFHTYS
jgi:Uma2 family endonuclease